MKTIRSITIAITILGFVGFTGMFICYVWLSGVFPQTIELPIAEANGLAIDDEGHIYVGSLSYARIQTYDSDGRFLWGAYLGTTKLSIFINITGDKVEVITSQYVLVFDKNGKLLHKKSSGNGQYAPGDSVATDDKGNTYSIMHPSMWPQVVKRSPDGDEHAVVSPKLYLWLVSGPFPAWLFGAVGGMLERIISKFGNIRSDELQEDDQAISAS